MVIKGSLYSHYSYNFYNKSFNVNNIKLKPIFFYKKYIFNSSIIYCIPEINNKTADINLRYANLCINDINTSYEIVKDFNLNFKIKINFNNKVLSIL